MKIRCNLCGEYIRQRDEIIRCCIERVRKEKGDPSDPERFSAVQDWHCSFIAHSECCKEEIQKREAQVEIPCENEILSLFEPEDDDKHSILQVVK